MADVKTLTDFYQKLKDSGVRLQNQFQIVINSGHSEVDSALEDITIWAAGAMVPGRTQNIAEMNYLGFKLSVPSNFEYTTELPITIRCDSANKVRNALLKWQSYISNAAISAGSSGEGDKKIPSNSFIRLRLFDPSMENELNVYKLFGVIPTIVGELEMSNETAEISTFESTFVYQFWELDENRSGFFNELR